MESGLSRLHTEPLVTQRTWDMDGIPVLFASISIPRPQSEEFLVQRRIRRFYAAQHCAYLRYCERWLYPQAAAACRTALEISAPLPQFRAELTYCVTYNENGFWSLYTQSDETLDGERVLSRRGDTWNLSTGYPVELSACFPHRSRWKAYLTARAAEEIRQQERMGFPFYHPDWHKLLRRRFNSRNFYLVPEGLVFFYPMYSIASEQAGIPTFLIPCDAGKREPGAFAPGSG